MRVLISGGAGFIGSHTAEALRNGKHQVLILDNFSTGRMENIIEMVNGGAFYEHSDVSVTDGSVSQFPSVNSLFEQFRPEVVLHLAAQAAITTAIQNPVHDLTVNAIGTLNIIKCCLKYDVKRLVFSSTSAVYKENKNRLWKSIKESCQLEPGNPYGISKLTAENYIRSMFPNHVILRYGNVYGPRQTPIGENQVVPRMIRHLKYGDEFYIHGSGNQTRDFVYVADVVKANTYALFGGEPGTYNIAGGRGTSVNEIGQIVAERYRIPNYKWDHTTTEDPRHSVRMDISAAKKGLTWTPKVSIVEGIEKTIQWWEGKS